MRKNELEKSLKLSCDSILYDDKHQHIREFFEGMGITLDNAYKLNSFPEEDSYIYEILVNKTQIFVIEIFNDQNHVIELQRFSLHIYRNSKIMKTIKRRLECALNL